MDMPLIVVHVVMKMSHMVIICVVVFKDRSYGYGGKKKKLCSTILIVIVSFVIFL